MALGADDDYEAGTESDSLISGLPELEIKGFVKSDKEIPSRLYLVGTRV